MEIGALPPSGYPLAQFTEPRVVRDLTRQLSGTQEITPAINKDRKAGANQRSALPSNTDYLKNPQVLQPYESQIKLSDKAEREDQKTAPATEAQRTQQQQKTAVAKGGVIKLEIEDGHRVLKLFDSKDVLIYQLPPKGELRIIETQDKAPQPQVQTSA